MQLKTVEHFVDVDGVGVAVTRENGRLWLSVSGSKEYIAEIKQQDRQDTITAVIEIIKDELRNAPLEVQMTKGVVFANIITKLQALSPKE